MLVNICNETNIQDTVFFPLLYAMHAGFSIILFNAGYNPLIDFSLYHFKNIVLEHSIFRTTPMLNIMRYTL